MKPASSLRFRLMAANVLVKQVVILLAAIYLMHVVDKLIRREAAAELEAIAATLAANTSQFRDNNTSLSGESAGRAGTLSQASRYWQVKRGTVLLSRSESLKGSPLVLPAGLELSNQIVNFDSMGPRGEPLFAAGILAKDAGTGTAAGEPVEIIVARSTEDLAGLWREFRNAVILTLGGIAALLLTSAWIQVNVGLRPAEMLRSSIERIRLGQARRLGPGFPDELQPLIDETNRLLETQENAVQTARARAGDLAHGLKTPLTAVTALAEQLREAGESRLSTEILRNVGMASRHVERELARTRIAATSGFAHVTSLFNTCDRLRATMERLPRGDELDWDIEIGGDLSVAVDEADLIEVVGSLLDNARKWAATRVCISARVTGEHLELRVEDDGPGVAECDCARVLRRGIRLDESTPGTGLGLTIVKDIAEAYGGSITLYRAPSGGLGVCVALPAAAAGGVGAVKAATALEPRVPPRKTLRRLPA